MVHGSTLEVVTQTLIGYGANDNITGYIEVSGASTVTSTGWVKLYIPHGTGTNVTASVLITGAGTTWTVSDSTYVGQATPGAGTRGTLTIADGATLNAYWIGIYTNGTVALSNATIIGNTQGICISVYGRLEADGTIGDPSKYIYNKLYMGGAVAPGGSNSIGTIAYNRVYFEVHSGTLEFELNSTNEFDKITATRSMWFDYDDDGDGGDIVVTVLDGLDGFIPKVGDTFDLITLSSETITVNTMPTLTMVISNPKILLGISGSLSIVDSNRTLRLTITDVDLLPTGTIFKMK